MVIITPNPIFSPHEQNIHKRETYRSGISRRTDTIVEMSSTQTSGVDRRSMLHLLEAQVVLRFCAQLLQVWIGCGDRMKQLGVKRELVGLFFPRNLD